MKRWKVVVSEKDEKMKNWRVVVSKRWNYEASWKLWKLTWRNCKPFSQIPIFLVRNNIPEPFCHPHQSKKGVLLGERVLVVLKKSTRPLFSTRIWALTVRLGDRFSSEIRPVVCQIVLSTLRGIHSAGFQHARMRGTTRSSFVNVLLIPNTAHLRVHTNSISKIRG